MQSIAPVTTDQLLARGQDKPLAKFEIYNNASWIDLGKMYPPLGLVGWWAFDEGTGTKAYDHSKNANHGDLKNMEEGDWVDGKIGKALDFDGVNEYIDLGSKATLEFTDSEPWSFSHWINWTEQALLFVFYAGYIGSNMGFLLRQNNDNRFGWRDKDGGYHLFASGSSTPYIGTWTHLVWTADGSGGLSLYINGELFGAFTSISTQLWFDAIGRGYSNSDYNFKGLVDEVRIYNRALTPAEIKALADLKSKNYLEDWNISLGGAGMTPNPIGGTWGVDLSNEGSVFHPRHPTSAFINYLVTGRKARLSIGGKYGGTPYYWQRIIGHMDEPSFDVKGFKVSISGGDYMKFLQDTELKSPDNYWPVTPKAYQTFSTFGSDGIAGNELYTEADAMDILNEQDNVDNWTPSYCTFVSQADAGAGSALVGKAVLTSTGPASVINTAVGSVTAGKEYLIKFKYKRVSGNGEMDVRVQQNGTTLGSISGLVAITYTESSFHFIADSTGSVKIRIGFESAVITDEFRIDQFSIFEFIPYDERYYELPVACKGPYRVLLKQNGTWDDVWEGEEDEGWLYEQSTRRLAFDINKTVIKGTSNLKIYYFTTQPLENVLADLLVTAGLYANQAAALADMDYTDPAVDIDQVYFDEGTTILDAVKKICERCDYRFWFSYAGKPVFKPKPSPGSTAFTFTDQEHILSATRKEDRNEIRNRIVIEGKDLAAPVNKKESLPPKLRGEDSDQTSIDTYGERTLTIKNHLFQDQTSIDNMCSSLLAEYKDPKAYYDVETIYCPAPLEMGDKISFKERMDPSTEVTTSAVIRDIKLSKWNVTYPCEEV